MKSYGSCAAAITCDRPIPLPTRPRERDEDHITARLERQRTRTPGVVLLNPAEFTTEQLQAAGFTVSGAPKPKKQRRSPVNTGPRPELRRFDHDAAVAAYLQGGSTKAIADEHGVTTAAILNAVRDAGHEVRAATGARRPGEVRVMPRRFDYATAVTAYLAGATVAHLAGQHQVSENTIRRVIRDAGHQLRPATATWDREAAVAEYVAGESSTAVAARHGVTDHTIRDAVKAAGHAMHDASAHTRAHIDDEAIRSLYLEDMLSPPTIAKRLGIQPRTVRTSLDRQGVERRDDRARCSGGANRLPERVLKAAAELYATGLTRTQVADRLGIGVKSVDAGIALVGATPRPAAHVAGSHTGVDGAAALKELMRTNEITSHDVRAWARATGRPCSDVGIPPRHLVEDYLLARPTTSTTNRKAATA